MAGDNQHFIPRHFLWGFAVRGQPKYTYVYRAGTTPQKSRLKKLAVVFHFYSAPSVDGMPTLDDAITDYENTTLSQWVKQLRDMAPGPVEAGLAANLVAHLSMRGEHVRSNLATGIRLMLKQAVPLLSQDDYLRRLVGLGEKSQRRPSRKNSSPRYCWIAALPAVAFPKQLLLASPSVWPESIFPL